ncbi:MAG: peroxidase-related enzyme [Geothrix sp.]|uniref:carboxymuconolactone decarboxylase family protein n=1 Tax=Geothrix sp. TaxID=1962974 RepID=UPI0017ABAD07|nr:peroxidase-related enzyme [Geothrix sp.]NWJ41368.1 peroxidase-related enzyme [Geothrix sp.]WIL20645.1 MAG: peroxidase-related enzyme [Geothrix sp.]
MATILPLDPTQASPEVASILQAVKAKLGRVPNLFLTLAKAPAALKAYLGASEAIGTGHLDAPQREVIALAVAEANGCDYCLAAHSAIGKMVGLDADTILQARSGVPANRRQAALAAFARAVVRERGRVSPLDLQAAREAGLDDQDLLEVVANVAINVLTNYTNLVAGTVVDFPKVERFAHV